KHRSAVVSIAIILMLLAAGVVGISVSLSSAIAERDRAKGRLIQQQYATAMLHLVLAASSEPDGPNKGILGVATQADTAIRMLNEIGRPRAPEIVLARLTKLRRMERNNIPGAFDEAAKAEELGWSLLQERGNVELFGGL